MKRPSCHSVWRALRPVQALLLAMVAGLLSAGFAAAQSSTTDPTALRTQVESRYDALPLRDGVALRPKSAATGIRSIEITRGSIAIDGEAVTGAELRNRLGTDENLVLQLSYLDDAQRAALFGPARPATPPTPAAPPTPPTAAPEPPTPPSVPNTARSRRERRGGDRVRFGGSLTVEEGESVAGDVVVIGGSADIEGEVVGDVVVVGGALNLGPRAEITKDAVVVGGRLTRDPGARIGGEVSEVGMGPFNFDPFSRFPRRTTTDRWWRNSFGSAFSLVSTLVRVCVLALLCALVVLFAGDYVDRIGKRAMAEPVKAGAVGLLAQLLFIPLLVVTIVLFVITIVGIPLLVLIPFAILGVMVLALAGFAGVAVRSGRWVSERFGLGDYGPIMTAVVGVGVIVSPLLLARLVNLGGGPMWMMAAGLTFIGFVAEYLAWTIGCGAVALDRFGRVASSGPSESPIITEPTA